MKYSVGVTTYSYRYNKFLTGLLKDIRMCIDNEIILAVNGEYKQEFDEEYRRNILALSANYANVFPFVYPEFRSLAKLWNTIVINSSNEYVLILNDDTAITDKSFFTAVEDSIERYQTSFSINHSFCHFVIKKSELDEVGWFDERFLGIGWEDWDFKDRYKAWFERPVLTIPNIKGITSYVDGENAIVNQQTVGKYSAFNQGQYNQNLKPIKQYPYERFYQSNKYKL